MSFFDQAILSARLQLLHEFCYCNLDMPYQSSGTQSNKDTRSKNAHSEIRILDTIAVLLTTGHRGDVTAIALDRRGRLQLVLAKNGPPTPADDRAVQDLISVLVDPATIDPEHVFPFLMTHCLENMRKRCTNLWESVSKFIPEIKSVLLYYLPQSIDNELPGSTAYRRLMYENGEPDLKEMIFGLFHFCTVQSHLSLDPDDLYASHMAYGDLYLAADALSHSRFLNEFIRDPSNPARKAMAEKLKRRLLKVCQYYGDVGKVIKNAKRWFPNGAIPYRWASVTDGRDGEDLEISIPVEALWRAPGAFITEEAMELLRQRFPEMFKRWPSIVHPRIHAELRIILDLNPPLTHIPEEPVQKPIGCSKRSCFCCTLWIAAFNRIFLTNWMTGGSHGKPCANWAIPDAAYAVGDDGKSRVDTDVFIKVTERLVDARAWLVRDTRDSDENRSSSEGISEDERIKSRYIEKRGLNCTQRNGPTSLVPPHLLRHRQ
jgi:hypothetical protein